ncbi:MAG TPA: hypothetical protein VH740_22125 [Vicinamibacterales bacterium]|jgi:hypothetical protein
MNTMMLRRTAAIVTVAAVTLGSQALAETPRQTRLTGLIHDYTAALDAAGPWQVVGEWSLTVNNASGKVDFIASLSMVRSESAVRSAHTHHVRLSDGDVTVLANGYRISGTATFTSNGNLAGFSGSPIEIEVTGGSAVSLANMAVTFGGAAAVHFGAEPLTGVVTLRRGRGGVEGT